MSVTEPTSVPDGTPVLAVRGLEVSFATEHGVVPVVQDVTFDVHAGEVLGLVGESGSGKSVTSLAVMGLIPQPPGRITGGSIRYGGRELVGLSERELGEVRGSQISMVFQEPMTSLDPAFTVGEQIASVVRHHQGASKQAAWQRAIEVLDLVGIASPARRMREYPHTFSGGMRQRVMIAIALACEPTLLIADEPTTALDVTIQAQILELLQSLQAELGMSIVFVTHDLGVVSEVCDRTVVMYAGQVVEQSVTDVIFDQPLHPYTQGLLDCLPAERIGEALQPIPGVVPSAHQMPAGCRFHPRCEHAVDAVCAADPPALDTRADGRATRCVRVGELTLPGVAR